MVARSGSRSGSSFGWGGGRAYRYNRYLDKYRQKKRFTILIF